MADLIPQGIDDTTGQSKQLTAADSLINTSGTRITVPTAASQGVNSETLSASKTLTDSDPVLQLLNPDGANRDVNLPALTTASPYFIIINTSDQVAQNVEDNNLLFVLDSAGTVVATVDPGTGRYFVNDGSGVWYSFQSFNLEKRGGAKYPIFFNRNELGGNRQYVGLPAPLTVSTCYYNNQNPGGGALTVTLYKNGASTGSTFTTPTTNGQGLGVWSTPVSYATGDTISAQTPGGVVYFTIPYDLGLTALNWSGNSSTSDDYADVGHSQNALTSTFSSPRHEVYIPFDCSYVGIGYEQVNFGGGETIRVYVNGSLSQTTSAITATRGYISLTETAISAGDSISLRCGTSAAGELNWVLYLKCKYTAYQYGGNGTNGNDGFRVMGDPFDSTGLYTNGLTDSFLHTIVDDGKIAFLSYTTTAATQNTLEILASGRLDYVVGSLSASTDTITTITKQLVTEGFNDFRSRNFQLDAGSRLGFACSNASFPQGVSNWTIWMQH